MRITKDDYEAALDARYADLQELVKADVQLDGKDIDPDDRRMLKMRVINSLRKLEAKRAR